MTRTARFALPALLAAGVLMTASAAPIRIGIVEATDTYTSLTGLSAFLTAEGYTYTDFSAQYEAGTVPSLASIDCMIIGSFVTNDPQKKATYLAAATSLRGLVDGGGTVIVLCQADQDMKDEIWMEPPRSAHREDPDTDTAYPLEATHVLLTSPEVLLPANLTGWRIPSGSTAPRTSWEAFTSFAEGGVVLGANLTGTSQTLLEFGWGSSGRALFYAMALDKAYAGGNAVSHDAAVKLLRNALYYAQLVEDGMAPPLQLTPSGAYQFPIQGIVFMDNNRNGVQDGGEPGRANVGVSDGIDVVVTSATGAYYLPNAGKNPPFVYVSQPADVAKSATAFYHFPSGSDTAGTRFDFPLWPAGTPLPTTGVFFAQVTDVHTANTTDRALERAAFAEIYAMTPAADFVISTGDLLNSGNNDSEWQNYLPGVQDANVPFFNVVGNHDINGGGVPVGNYRIYFGPDYYSFDHGGIHFVVRNVVTPSAQQDAWLQQDLAALAGGQPIVFFQHYPPTAAELAQLDGWNVHSVYTGHWHSEKSVVSATTTSVNSPTGVMGGIDCSPAGFQLVWLGTDGSFAKEWRYGRVSQSMTIVWPPPGGLCNQHDFPICVNLYDAAVRVEAATWWVENFGNTIASGSLVEESPWSWTGRFQTAGNYLGSSILHVSCRDVLGRIWTRNQTFNLDVKIPATPQTSGDWPMFMGGPTHEGSTTVSLSTPMRLAWSANTEGDMDYSSPILAEGKLFVALKSRHSWARNGLIALDPASGQILWRRETAQAINHTPAYSNGILCIPEVGGRVYGIAASDGHIVWQQDLLDNLGRYNFCAPCAEGGYFYVGTLRYLARLSVLTGAVGWAGAVPGGGGSDWISSYGSPAVSGNTLAFGGMWASGNDMFLLNKNTEAAIWSHPADNGMHSSPTIVGNRLLFSGIISKLYCYDINTQASLWSQPIGTMWTATTPAVKGNVVVAGSGDGIMKGLNLTTGAVMWTHTSATSVFQISPYRRDWRGLLSSPTIAGDKVYFGSSDGWFYCLNLQTGNELWKLQLGVPVLSTPLVSGNALFFGSYDGRVYAFTEESAGIPQETPTPTHTGTPTDTGTPTPTLTPTGTPTNTPTFTHTPPPSDVNRDLWVNSKDLLELARYWMQPANLVPVNLQVDWDRDGLVDQADILFFVESWPHRH